MSMPSQLEQLEATLKEAISRAIQADALSGTVPDSIKLERPKDRSHGDYATSIALQISKAMGKNPREVALVIADQLTGIESINKVEIDISFVIGNDLAPCLIVKLGNSQVGRDD